MKNLRNLFLVGALLSTTALAAGPYTNPGDAVSETNNGEASAGVPLEVRVNVLGQGPELVLVDETDTVIDTLSFDHGNKILSEIGGKKVIQNKSTVEKIVIMKRTDGKPFNTQASGTGEVSGVTGYTAKFSIENSPNLIEPNVLQLVKLNSGAGETTPKFINTAIDYLDHDISVDKGATEVRTTVVSTIPARTEAEEGLYIGTGMFVGTLKTTASEVF